MAVTLTLWWALLKAGLGGGVRGWCLSWGAMPVGSVMWSRSGCLVARGPLFAPPRAPACPACPACAGLPPFWAAAWLQQALNKLCSRFMCCWNLAKKVVARGWGSFLVKTLLTRAREKKSGAAAGHGLKSSSLVSSPVFFWLRKGEKKTTRVSPCNKWRKIESKRIKKCQKNYPGNSKIKVFCLKISIKVAKLQQCIYLSAHLQNLSTEKPRH